MGKQVVRLSVRSEVSGQLPTYRQAGMRAAIQFLGYLAFGWGLLVVWLTSAFDPAGRRRGWHDKVAQTVVVQD